MVTWPISSIVTSKRLATSISAAVASRTAPTLPGVESAATSVCTESITHTAGRSASIVASTDSSEFSASTGTSSAASPSRCALVRIWAADSSPET